MTDVGTLKPGDEVAIRRHTPGESRYQLARVTRVSPTGQVTLGNGSRFNTSGYLIGDTDRWYRTTIVPATDEIREAVARQSLLSQIHAFAGKWADLPTDALRRVVAVIKAEPGRSPRP